MKTHLVLNLKQYLLIILSCWLTTSSAIASFFLSDYNRSDWKHWIDSNQDCQNTRHEMLIKDSLIPVHFRNSKNCSVKSGLWVDPFTLNIIRVASRTSIDHLIPLKEAHISGGAKWSKTKKMRFANDPENLLTVGTLSNAEKGSSTPDKWRPPNRQFWCEYAVRWKNVKAKYGLRFSKSEKSSLIEMLRTCEMD